MKSIKVKGIDKMYSVRILKFRDILFNTENLICIECTNTMGNSIAVIISKANWEKLKKL